jgi:hypothetical protein
MSKSRMWTYSLRIKLASNRTCTSSEWRVKSHKIYGPGYGAPTHDNIAKWVQGFEESTVSGPNKHVGPETVVSAEIIDQRTNRVVATWTRSK